MQVFLFDIDGTLIHSAGAGRAALDVAMKHAFDIESQNDVDLGGRTDRGIADELFYKHDLEHNESNWRRFQDAYIAALPERMREKQGAVLPGVIDLLDRLTGLADVHLGLLTGNVERGAEIKLSHFDLWRRFAFGGFGDRHADRNDVAQEAKDAALDRLDTELPANRFFVIGDTIRDVRCARAIGAKSIAVCTGSSSRDELHAERPDLILENLEQGGAWWESA